MALYPSPLNRPGIMRKKFDFLDMIVALGLVYVVYIVFLIVTGISYS